jgi:hypothetical protein
MSAGAGCRVSYVVSSPRTIAKAGSGSLSVRVMALCTRRSHPGRQKTEPALRSLLERRVVGRVARHLVYQIALEQFEVIVLREDAQFDEAAILGHAEAPGPGHPPLERQMNGLRHVYSSLRLR